MEAGQRYYVIAEAGTDNYLTDDEFETLRFDQEQDAIDYLTDFLEVENLEDYEVVCLRW